MSDVPVTTSGVFTYTTFEPYYPFVLCDLASMQIANRHQSTESINDKRDPFASLLFTLH